VCNILGLLFGIAGVLLLVYLALPVEVPVQGLGEGGGPMWEAKLQRYDRNALEAVPPFCTAIGKSWRRRPITPLKLADDGD
jgi:hypothetical protein